MYNVHVCNVIIVYANIICFDAYNDQPKVDKYFVMTRN